MFKIGNTDTIHVGNVCNMKHVNIYSQDILPKSMQTELGVFILVILV